MRVPAAIGVSCLGVTLFATSARADCARPPEYSAAQSGSSVIICEPYPPLAGDCMPGAVMLRQEVDSGTVVQLAAFCADGGCYQDDCVPPGTYHYGLQTPLKCSGCGNDAPYWASITVADLRDAGCTWTPGNSAPTAHSGAPPWPASAENSVCPPSKNGIGCGCGDASVLGIDGVLLAVSLGLLWRRRRG